MASLIRKSRVDISTHWQEGVNYLLVANPCLSLPLPELHNNFFTKHTQHYQVPFLVQIIPTYLILTYPALKS